MINYFKMKQNEWKVKTYFYAMILKFINEQKDILTTLEHLSGVLKDTHTSNESKTEQSSE